ncbi:MAG: FAD:protein FMN transferase [Clostridiales bacterium]|nr:FAD:protein FMN transferase [Clostridiales bacterium]
MNKSKIMKIALQYYSHSSGKRKKDGFMNLPVSCRRAAVCITVTFILCLASQTLSGCAQMRTANETELILGTVINVTLYGNSSQESLDHAASAAMDKARELEQIFSAALEESELNDVNQNAAKGPVHVSHDLYTVLERSLYFADLTNGAFDPTLGKLIKLWGIGTDHARLPGKSEISPLAGQKNYKKVILNKTDQTVQFTGDGFELDLGAIAKGYAADEMKKLLVDDYGITSGLLNLGGNIITIGSRYDGQPWTLGIADPQNPQDLDHPAVLLKMTGKTFVTSGDYQRYYTAPDGKKYHHILDSATGYPADTGLSSVTIITDCSMDADALSTASFVLGEERATDLLSTMDGIDAVFIAADGEITATPGIQSQLYYSLEP